MKAQNFESTEMRNERLANALCLTVEELERIPHEIIGDSDESGALRGYVIQFSGTTPTQILGKIRGLDTSNKVYISASMVDRDVRSRDTPDTQSED